MYIGLFPSASTPTIGAGEEVVETTGYSVIGVGGAHYVHDAAVNAAYVTANPRTAFLSADGRGWRLNESEPEVTMFGCLVHATPPSAPIQTANSDALQTAMWSGLPLRLPAGVIWLKEDIPLFPWRHSGSPSGVSGVSKITGAGRSRSVLRFNTTNAVTRPCISIPEGYVDGADNLLYDTNGALMPNTGGSGPPTGRSCAWKGFTIHTSYGRYATCLFITNTVGDLFEDMAFSGAHRGYFNPAAFNSTLINIELPGLYYLGTGRTATEKEEQFEESFGMFFNHHTNVIQVSGTGWGTTINAGGVGSSIIGARLEVAECALRLGGKNFQWDLWNGSAFITPTRNFGGRVADITTESNRWGVIAKYGAGALCENMTITGSAGAVPSVGAGGRAPAVGMAVYPGFTNKSMFRQCLLQISGTIYGKVVNAGAIRFEDCNVTDGKGINALLSTFTPDPFRLINELVNRSVNGANPPERRTLSVDSQLVHTGLTQLNIRDPLVLSRKLGGTADVTAAATFVDITFPPVRTSGTAQFVSPPTAVTGTSTLAPNTYYYAVTLIGTRGETGVEGYTGQAAGPPLSFSPTITYKSVTTASGEKADMSFINMGALYRHRIYRGTAPGVFDGYFEIPGTTTAFSDSGQAFDGQDVPPPVGASIPSQQEVDTNYIVPAVEVGWDTRWWITNKATTGFRINFSNAPGANTTAGWLIARV